MAATVTSAWAKPGAWALESEESEAMENLHNPYAPADAAPADPSDFPSLAAAATAKGSKKKKKLSLAEFTTGLAVTPGAARARPSAPEPKGLTPDELLSLPTRPRERTAEELERGFSYRGFNRGGGREESGPNRWGSSRGSDEGRRPRSEAGGFDRESAPSRADEIDDWGAMKKTAPPPVERRERNGGFFDSQSRADESDSWISNKGLVSVPVPAANGRGGSDGFKERRGGFAFGKEGSGGAESDSWGRKKEDPSPAGERRKLVLQPRTLPLEKENASGGEQQLVKSKAANPFGAARPREEVLAEKGQDWMKIDEKLESMKIREAKPGSRDGNGFARRSSGPAAALEDRWTDKKWRKDETAVTTAPASSEKAEEGAGDE